MTKEERLFYCTKCINRKFDRQTGIFCGISGSQPQFEGNCIDYRFDVELEKQAIAKAKNKELIYEKEKINSVLHGSIIGGIMMMAGGTVWLIWGLIAGWFFFYAPILAFLGLVSFITGIIKQKRLRDAKKKKNIDVLDNLQTIE